MSITSPARLRWLARHRPDIFGRIHSLGMLSDWIVYRLAQVQVTEPSCGSSSGMFNLASRGWSAKIAQICGEPAPTGGPARAGSHAIPSGQLKEEPMANNDSRTEGDRFSPAVGQAASGVRAVLIGDGRT